MTIFEQRTHEQLQQVSQHICDITLRDLFAMSALNGIVSSGLVYNSTPKYKISATAYEFADAMLETREGK